MRQCARHERAGRLSLPARAIRRLSLPARAIRMPPNQPELNGATSGFMPENRPAGFGYQTHTCIVIRSGCQNVNLAPLRGALAGHEFAFLSGMNVPSAKWHAAGNEPNVASGSGGLFGILVNTHSRAPSCQEFGPACS